ncbi:hypothetical protein BSU6633_18228 [Bacillus spizizenii ATCC 6633 = JCM 2499]|nr:hypothetical protein BSU6633_18228 [Bacillus spizizenii ATCC 6633 = JCM 2499]
MKSSHTMMIISIRGDLMLNSEHFNLIQRALDATANELKELGTDSSPSVMSHALNDLEKAVEHIYSTDHPFLSAHVINRK